MFFHTSVQNKKEEEKRKKEQELMEIQQQKQHAESILQQKFLQNPVLAILLDNMKVGFRLSRVIMMIEYGK